MDEPVLAANPAEEAEASPAPDGDAAVRPQGEEPAGDLTKTQAFSRRLNAMTQRAVDDFVGSLGLVDRRTGEPIATRAQYEAMRENAAIPEAQAAPPADARELSALRGALAESRLREQDARLLADPALGDAYRALRGEALELAGYCRAQGGEAVDLNAAFAALLETRAGEVLQQVRSAAAAEAVRRAQAARLASPGRLGGGELPAAGDYAAMSDAEFERQIALAKNGGLRSR